MVVLRTSVDDRFRVALPTISNESWRTFLYTQDFELNFCVGRPPSARVHTQNVLN